MLGKKQMHEMQEEGQGILQYKRGVHEMPSQNCNPHLLVGQRAVQLYQRNRRSAGKTARFDPNRISQNCEIQ